MRTTEKDSKSNPELERFKKLLMEAMDDHEFLEKLAEIIGSLLKRRKLIIR